MKDAGFATVHESAVGKKAITREWTEKELVAQCFLFFLAGFDTVSTALGFLMYELMRNREVQERLYEEIAEIDQRLDGKPLTYDAVQGMRYMDMVVSESLRLVAAGPDGRSVLQPGLHVRRWRGAAVQDRKGSHGDGTGSGPTFRPKVLPRSEAVRSGAVQRENRHKINPGAYLPFGVGPRNCIGSRFALMEVKSIIYYLLKSFTFERCEQTQMPLRLKNSPVVLAAEKGIWIRFKPREVAK